MTSHWFCDSGSMPKPQHSGHLSPWGSSPGPHRSVTPTLDQGTHAELNAASSGEIRRWLWRHQGESSRSASLLNEVSCKHNRTELEAQVTDEEQQRNAHRPPLGALVLDMDAGDREIGARRVGSSAEVACNNHTLDGPRGVPQLARDEEWNTRVVGLKGVLVEDCAAVLGGHMEVALQGHVAAERRAVLHTDHMPRAVEVTCQQTYLRQPCFA